jgi:hypothetical protein
VLSWVLDRPCVTSPLTDRSQAVGASPSSPSRHDTEAPNAERRPSRSRRRCRQRRAVNLDQPSQVLPFRSFVVVCHFVAGVPPGQRSRSRTAGAPAFAGAGSPCPRRTKHSPGSLWGSATHLRLAHGERRPDESRCRDREPKHPGTS